MTSPRRTAELPTGVDVAALAGLVAELLAPNRDQVEQIAQRCAEAVVAALGPAIDRIEAAQQRIEAAQRRPPTTPFLPPSPGATSPN